MLAVGPGECQNPGRQRPEDRDRAEMGRVRKRFKGRAAGGPPDRHDPGRRRRRHPTSRAQHINGQRVKIKKGRDPEGSRPFRYGVGRPLLGAVPRRLPRPDTPVEPASCRHASVLITLRHINTPLLRAGTPLEVAILRRMSRHGVNFWRKQATKATGSARIACLLLTRLLLATLPRSPQE